MILAYYFLTMMIWSLIAIFFLQIPSFGVVLFDAYTFQIVFWVALSPLSAVFFLLAIGIFLPTLFTLSDFFDESFLISIAVSLILSLSFITTYKVIVKRRVRYSIA